METAQRRRGIGLSIWLPYLFLANVWGAYRMIEILLDDYQHGGIRFDEKSTWIVLALAALEVVAVAAIAAMWFWRKMGCYVYITCTIIALLITLVIGAVVALLFTLINLAITWWLLQSRWENFE